MEEACSPRISPTLDLETPPFWRYPMTTRRTALCSSERILASFRGSRLSPERSSKSSDLGARIHSVPRSSRRHGAQLESSSSSPSSASAAVTLARVAQTPRFLNLSTTPPPSNSGTLPRKASHDGFPQVDVRGLDFNEFFQGPAGFSSTKSVAHASAS